MIKILFVCHGNICRSPMGEFILKDMVARRGLAEKFEIASAAVSTEEIGNPVYPPARAELKRHGIDCTGHRARQITRADFDRFDRIYYMDDSNAVHKAMDRFISELPATLSGKNMPNILGEFYARKPSFNFLYSL